MTSPRRQRLAALTLTAKPRRQVLYAVEFSNGIVKIGTSGNVLNRMVQLDREAFSVGASVTRFHAEPIAVRGLRVFHAERELIERMTRIANQCRDRMEFFSHV